MADSVRRIVGVLYERACEEEKKQAREYFEILDLNGDGKIDLAEFQNKFRHERDYKQLSSNANEGLSFEDSLVLFYFKKKSITILGCDGCHELILGPSFSCFECLFDSSHDSQFDVCCDCYGAGKFRHPHPLSPIGMFNEQALLGAASKRRTDGTQALSKKKMEKLSKIAELHYRAASPEVQAMANKFYKSMDTDGDSGVDLEEYLTFMRENGYGNMHSNQFYKMLDLDGNGSLTFWEVMTLYYIIKSGRPCCNSCADFIPGIYFSCVDCFYDAETSYNICQACYESGKCKHKHDGARALFLDNFTLLQAKRRSNPPRVTSTPSTPNTHYVDPHRCQHGSSSLALIIAPPPRTSALDRVSSAFHALEAAITVASLSTSTVCTIL